jgi:hypothetical protein
MKNCFILFFVCLTSLVYCQNNPLKVEKIVLENGFTIYLNEDQKLILLLELG